MSTCMIDRNTLYEYYVIRGEPMHKVAELFNIAVGTVYNYLKKYNIPTRSTSESFQILKDKGWKYPEDVAKQTAEKRRGRKMTDEQRRKISENKFKGGIGHKKHRDDGYVAIYFPEHPRSNSDGYIMEHILVMECYLGRPLNDDEVVHHINHIRDDNRIKNLQVMTFKEHAGLHMRERQEAKRKNKDNRKE